MIYLTLPLKHSTEAPILKLFVFELTMTYVQSAVTDENYFFTFHYWWLNHQKKEICTHTLNSHIKLVLKYYYMRIFSSCVCNVAVLWRAAITQIRVTSECFYFIIVSCMCFSQGNKENRDAGVWKNDLCLTVVSVGNCQEQREQTKCVITAAW